MSEQQKRQCGTCGLWGDEEVEGLRQCMFAAPPLPFWVRISSGADHADWTQAANGKHCPCWQPKVQP